MSGRLVAHHGPPSLRTYRWVRNEAEALPGEVVEYVEGKRLDGLLAMEAACREAEEEARHG